MRVESRGRVERSKRDGPVVGRGDIASTWESGLSAVIKRISMSN